MYPFDVLAKNNNAYLTRVAPDATIGIMAVICNHGKKCEFVDFVVWNIINDNI